VPNFRRYVSEQALSLIGTWVETAAQALLVLRLTHSGTVAAVLAGTVGIGWCFVVNAASFVIVIAWVALKPRVTSGLAGAQALPVQQAVK
jgi:hypothetical protein